MPNITMLIISCFVSETVLVKFVVSAVILEIPVKKTTINVILS